MNSEVPLRILKELQNMYDKDPTGIISTKELASLLKISIKDAQGALIYLKEKDLINSFQRFDEWFQKINAYGIDELQRNESNTEKLKDKPEQTNINEKLTKIEEKIKEVNLEKERRKGVAEQKFYGAVIEMFDILRSELKRREENTNEITETKVRLSKLENLFSNPQEQLIDNVYRPCYNQMINVYNSREFIHRIPENKWIELEAYWRLKTEPEMIKLFEKYTNEREKWSKLWVEFANAIQSQHHKLGDIVAKAFAKSGLIKDEKPDIHLDERSSMEARNWVEAFDQVILDTSVNNPETLYKNLLNYAIQTKNGHQKWLENWWNANNGLYDNLLDIIPELKRNFTCSVTKKQLDEQRNILKKSIEELTLALEDKLK